MRDPEIVLITDRDELLTVVPGLTDVYRLAFGAAGYDEPEDAVARFRDEQLPRHAARDGFRGLEGVVAKRERDPYRPGERLWVKTKSRATARFAEERDGVGRRVSARA